MKWSWCTRPVLQISVINRATVNAVPYPDSPSTLVLPANRPNQATGELEVDLNRKSHISNPSQSSFDQFTPPLLSAASILTLGI